MQSHDNDDPILKSFLEVTQNGTQKMQWPSLNQTQKFEFGKGIKTVIPRKLEVYAAQGDPFCLVELGKQHYDRGQKELAFQYFDAAVKLDQKYDNYVSILAKLIGDNVREDEKKLKYYSLAIKKGNDELYRQQIKIYSNPEVLSNDELSDHYLFNAYAAKIDWAIRNNRNVHFSDTEKERFRRWRSAYPEKFETFCIENSLATMKMFMGDNVEREHINIYKQKLADKIISHMTEDNILDINIAKKKFEEEYHPEYFVGIEALVNETKEEIEKINAKTILNQIERSIDQQINLLLDQMKAHLKNHGHLKEVPSSAEEQFLDDILSKFSDDLETSSPEGQTSYIGDFDNTFKNSVESQALFLQLRAFKEVKNSFTLPERLPAYNPNREGSTLEEDQPGLEEKESNIEKLQRVVNAIEDANRKIKKENTYKAKLPGWSAFLISLTGLGIPIALAMAYSYNKHGTYDFFSSEQKIAAKKAKAAEKSTHAFNIIKEQKERSHNLPTFKHRK